MKRRSAKEKIIDTAIALFNQHGTGSISTNHIAKKMNISPGNLYYHYTNKEEIIREILERMIREMDDVWTGNWKDLFTEPDEKEEGSPFFLWDYRFFQKEIAALMQKDPLLKIRYQKIAKQRWGQIKGLIELQIESGLLKKDIDPELYFSLAQISWIVNDYWLSFLEVMEASVTKKAAMKGQSMTALLFEPYWTKKGRKALGID